MLGQMGAALLSLGAVAILVTEQLRQFVARPRPWVPLAAGRSNSSW